jgi:hypothetical protein
VLDPGAIEARWLTGFAVAPGNPRIVHHALVFLDTDAASDKLADADGGYDCFGGPRLSAPLLVGGEYGIGPVTLRYNFSYGKYEDVDVHENQIEQQAQTEDRTMSSRSTKSARLLWLAMAIAGTTIAQSFPPLPVAHSSTSTQLTLNPTAPALCETTSFNSNGS